MYCVVKIVFSLANLASIEILVMFLDGMIMSNNINKLPFFGVTCGMIMDHQEKAPWPT